MGIFCGLFCLILAAACARHEPADLVLRQGAVMTMDARNPRAEAVPHKSLSDAIVPDRPMALSAADGHSCGQIRALWRSPELQRNDDTWSN